MRRRGPVGAADRPAGRRRRAAAASSRPVRACTAATRRASTSGRSRIGASRSAAARATVAASCRCVSLTRRARPPRAPPIFSSRSTSSLRSSTSSVLLLRRERIRLPLQRADPLGRALRPALCARGGASDGACAPTAITVTQARRPRPRAAPVSEERLAIDVPGIGTPKYFSTVGAMSMIDGVLPRRSAGSRSARRPSSRSRSRRDRRSTSSCSDRRCPAAIRRASSATRPGSRPPSRPAAPTRCARYSPE